MRGTTMQVEILDVLEVIEMSAEYIIVEDIADEYAAQVIELLG
jgi:hypothetical protein